MEYTYPQPKDPRRFIKKLLLAAAALMVVGALSAGGWWVYRTFFRAKPQPNQPSQSPAAQGDAAPKPAAVQGRYLFHGTVVWARAIEKYAAGNYAQPFSQLDTFQRSAYDAWEVDLECPITDNTVPYQTQVESLVFNCRPEFLPEANKYFSLYNLANNHTDNQGGQTGIARTRAYLQKSGAQYFGNYEPTITKDICEVIALPVRVQKTDKTEDQAVLPVAFCAWHYFNYFRQPTAEELAVVKQYADVMPVLGFAEMGAEYHAEASEVQVNIAHALVDAGVDVVFANNPHWVQNAEVYKGKLIAYSLGNFIFDQLDAETQRSASIDTVLQATYDSNTAKWLALGPLCAAFQDDCLAQAQEQHLVRPSFTLRYGVVAGQGGAGKITHKADAATQAAVEARLGWPNVLSQLGQSATVPHP